MLGLFCIANTSINPTQYVPVSIPFIVEKRRGFLVVQLEIMLKVVQRLIDFLFSVESQIMSSYPLFHVHSRFVCVNRDLVLVVPRIPLRLRLLGQRLLDAIRYHLVSDGQTGLAAELILSLPHRRLYVRLRNHVHRCQISNTHSAETASSI